MSAKILLVEDDRPIAEGLSTLLTEEGYGVECAYNGQEALDLMQAPNMPQLVLLDLMMPVMTGWELREKMLLDSRLCQIPVAVLSGVSDLQVNEPTLRANAYFGKPLDCIKLLDFISSTLAGHSCGH
ncbi:MAG: response regulator [Deltaproteobacteria bacterium]|nr:MAG: response regulator [Deltaproteobacteria bacterium]